MKGHLIAFLVNLTVIIFVLLWTFVVYLFIQPLLYISGFTNEVALLWFSVCLGIILFFVPRIKYGMNPGRAVIRYFKDKTSTLMPVNFFFVVLLVSFISYFALILITDSVFGSMVKKQEHLLVEKGVNLDWKSYYYPDTDYNDKGNGAVYIKHGETFLDYEDMSKVSNLRRKIIDEKINVVEIETELNEILETLAPAIKEYDKVLLSDYVLWFDVNDIDAHRFMYNVKILYGRKATTYLTIKLAQMRVAYLTGDFNGAERKLDQIIKFTNIISKKPTAYTVLVKDFAIDSIYSEMESFIEINGLNSKIVRLYRKVANDIAVGSLPVGSESLQLCKRMAATWNATLKDIEDGVPDYKENEKMFSYRIVESDTHELHIVVSSFLKFYERPFQRLDRFFMLKSFNVELNRFNESDYEKRQTIKNDLVENFMRNSMSIATGFSRSISAGYSRYLNKELMFATKNEMVKFLISAYDYKKKYGKSPANMETVVKEFNLKMPVNYMNGEPINYKVLKNGKMEVSTPKFYSGDISFSL